MGSVAEDLRFRHLVHQVTHDALLARLDGGSLTLYAGFDPTAPSLHVGSLLQLCLLRRLQMAGHRPIALAGGGTGMIGDPGGKAEERPLPALEELDRNLEGIAGQLARFLHFEDHPDRPSRRDRQGPGAASEGQGAILLDNREWLGQMGVLEFLRDVGKHFTVNQMVAKESVRARFERPDHGISFTEFSYMLLQAYDFLHLHDHYGCVLQVGGSDQWGNITMGAELVRKVRRQETYGLTTPLVIKADGTKFGKTEQGTVWLDASLTSPYRFYQFFVQSEDAVVGDYIRYFTFLPHEEIQRLDRAVSERPQGRQAQRALAWEVTCLVHGKEEASRAERASRALFDGSVSELDAETLEAVVEDSPSTTISHERLAASATSDSAGSNLALVDALVDSGLASSKRDGRRKVTEGAVYLNDRRETDVDRILGSDDLLHGRYVILRRGPRQYHVLMVE